MSEPERDAFLAAFSVEHGETLVGLAVLGGIFGEGIDLVGERLIGAVIVGVGLPQLCVERNLNLGGGVFLIGAVFCEVCELRNGVRQRRARQRGFQEPLHEEIGKATVRRGGMGVVLHRQRKVAGCFAAGEIERVFAAPDEFDDRQGKVGELLWGGGAATVQETFERDRLPPESPVYGRG
jgi:hypothetical protein